MDVARKTLVPPRPTTVQELAECIEKYADMTDFYRGSVTGDDGSTSLIFVTNTMKKVLEKRSLRNKIERLLQDGKFSVRKAIIILPDVPY